MKFKKILLLFPIFNMLRFGLLISLFKNIKLLFKELTCDHSWRYWNIKFKNDRPSINRITFPKWRRCEKCNKQQSLKTIPGDFKWVKSYKYLPENSNTIEVEVLMCGEETKEEKRDRILKSILKK